MSQDNQAMVQYGTFDVSSFDDDDAEIAKGYQSEYLTLPVGRTPLRFMPPKDRTAKSPFHVFWEHFIKLPGYSRAVVFVCPQIAKGKPCPACVKSAALARSGNPHDMEQGKFVWAAKFKVAANVIARPMAERGPLIFKFGKGIYDDLRSLRKNEDTGGNYTHPETGFDIVIERTGEGRDTGYEVHAARRQSPLGNMDWISQQWDLVSKLPVHEFTELEEMFTEARAGGRGRSQSARPHAAKPAAETSSSEVIDAVPDNQDNIPF